MCGRFCLDTDLATIIEYFSLRHNVVLKPRYNIAPSQVVPVIREPGKLEFLVWGLRPSWLKAEHNSFVNARLETLAEKPSFKQAFNKRRCLIVANGYYEWKQIGKIKQPYFISLPQRELFAFAGIWDGDTCSIITTPAQHAQLSGIHERMPVVLNKQYCDLWMSPEANIQELLNFTTNNNYQFVINAVSTQVNSPKHDSMVCTQPLQ